MLGIAQLQLNCFTAVIWFSNLVFRHCENWIILQVLLPNIKENVYFERYIKEAKFKWRFYLIVI